MITVFVRIPVYDSYGYENRDPEEVAEDIVDKIKKAGFSSAELDDILWCHLKKEITYEYWNNLRSQEGKWL